MYQYLPDHGYAGAIQALWPYREYACQRQTLRALFRDLRAVRKLFDDALAFDQAMTFEGVSFEWDGDMTTPAASA